MQWIHSLGNFSRDSSERLSSSLHRPPFIWWYTVILEFSLRDKRRDKSQSDPRDRELHLCVFVYAATYRQADIWSLPQSPWSFRSSRRAGAVPILSIQVISILVTSAPQFLSKKMQKITRRIKGLAGIQRRSDLDCPTCCFYLLPTTWTGMRFMPHRTMRGMGGLRSVASARQESMRLFFFVCFEFQWLWLQIVHTETRIRVCVWFMWLTWATVVCCTAEVEVKSSRNFFFVFYPFWGLRKGGCLNIAGKLGNPHFVRSQLLYVRLCSTMGHFVRDCLI